VSDLVGRVRVVADERRERPVEDGGIKLLARREGESWAVVGRVRGLALEEQADLWPGWAYCPCG